MSAGKEQLRVEDAAAESKRMRAVRTGLEIIGWLAALALLAFASRAVFAEVG